jgi:hypothetical protein
LGNRSPELVDANDRPGRVCRRPCARAARRPPVGVRSTKIGHPFRLAARRSRSRYRRRKDVKVERVEWIVVPEPSVAAAALADGEVDWWENSSPDLARVLAANPDLAVEDTAQASRQSARSSLTTLPTALAPIGLMTVPAAIRWVVPLIDRPA